MSKSKNLVHLISNLNPTHNPGEYVYVHVAESSEILSKDAVMEFKEKRRHNIDHFKSKSRGFSARL